MDGAVDITALIAPGFGPNDKHAGAAELLYRQCNERQCAVLALPINISAALRTCLASLASLSASDALERSAAEALGIKIHQHGDEVGLELREGGRKTPEVWSTATIAVRSVPVCSWLATASSRAFTCLMHHRLPLMRVLLLTGPHRCRAKRAARPCHGSSLAACCCATAKCSGMADLYSLLYSTSAAGLPAVGRGGAHGVTQPVWSAGSEHPTLRALPPVRYSPAARRHAEPKRDAYEPPQLRAASCL